MIELVVELGFPLRAGRYQPGGLLFRPRLVGGVDVWKDIIFRDGIVSSPGAAEREIYPGQSGMSQSGFLGFHTVQGGIESEYHRFHRRVIGVVDRNNS